MALSNQQSDQNFKQKLLDSGAHCVAAVNASETTIILTRIRLAILAAAAIAYSRSASALKYKDRPLRGLLAHYDKVADPSKQWQEHAEAAISRLTGQEGRDHALKLTKDLLSTCDNHFQLEVALRSASSLWLLLARAWQPNETSQPVSVALRNVVDRAFEAINNVELFLGTDHGKKLSRKQYRNALPAMFGEAVDVENSQLSVTMANQLISKYSERRHSGSRAEQLTHSQGRTGTQQTTTSVGDDEPPSSNNVLHGALATPTHHIGANNVAEGGHSTPVQQTDYTSVTPLPNTRTPAIVQPLSNSESPRPGLHDESGNGVDNGSTALDLTDQPLEAGTTIEQQPDDERLDNEAKQGGTTQVAEPEPTNDVPDRQQGESAREQVQQGGNNNQTVQGTEAQPTDDVPAPHEGEPTTEQPQGSDKEEGQRKTGSEQEQEPSSKGGQQNIEQPPAKNEGATEEPEHINPIREAGVAATTGDGQQQVTKGDLNEPGTETQKMQQCLDGGMPTGKDNEAPKESPAGQQDASLANRTKGTNNDTHADSAAQAKEANVNVKQVAENEDEPDEEEQQDEEDCAALNDQDAPEEVSEDSEEDEDDDAPTPEGQNKRDEVEGPVQSQSPADTSPVDAPDTDTIQPANDDMVEQLPTTPGRQVRKRNQSSLSYRETPDRTLKRSKRRVSFKGSSPPYLESLSTAGELSRVQHLRFEERLIPFSGLFHDPSQPASLQIATPRDLGLDSRSGPRMYQAFCVLDKHFNKSKTTLGDPSSESQFGDKVLLATTPSVAHEIEKIGFVGLQDVLEEDDGSTGSSCGPTRWGWSSFPPIISEEVASRLRKKGHPSKQFASCALTGERFQWKDPTAVVGDNDNCDPLGAEILQAMSEIRNDMHRIRDRLEHVFELGTGLEGVLVQLNTQRSLFPAHQDATYAAIVDQEKTISIVGGDGIGDVVATRTVAGRALIGLEEIDNVDIRANADGDWNTSVVLDFEKCPIAFEQRAGDVYALVGNALDLYVHAVDSTLPAAEVVPVWGRCGGSPCHGAAKGERLSITYRFRRSLPEHSAGPCQGDFSLITKHDLEQRSDSFASNSRVFNALTRHMDGDAVWKLLTKSNGIIPILDGDPNNELWVERRQKIQKRTKDKVLNFIAENEPSEGDITDRYLKLA